MLPDQLCKQERRVWVAHAVIFQQRRHQQQSSKVAAAVGRARRADEHANFAQGDTSIEKV